MKDGLVELQADSVVYYSQSDEDAFFKWLDTIPCVVNVEGSGRILYLDVKTEAVDTDALRELIAFFQRYSIDMKQLKQFDRPKYKKWLHDKDKYWYKKIFG